MGAFFSVCLDYSKVITTDFTVCHFIIDARNMVCHHAGSQIPGWLHTLRGVICPRVSLLFGGFIPLLLSISKSSRPYTLCKVENPNRWVQQVRLKWFKERDAGVLEVVLKTSWNMGHPNAHMRTCRCTPPITCVICIVAWSVNTYQILPASAHPFLSYS